MIHFAYWKPSLFLFAVTTVGTAVWRRAMATDQSAIAETIKAVVAQVAAGINAHDPIKTTAYDASDIISMECGRPSTVGIEADREGFRLGFQHDPQYCRSHGVPMLTAILSHAPDKNGLTTD